MMINVSFDGRKLDWDGAATEVAEMDHRVAQIAALGNVSPETLWQSTLSSIAANGGRFSTPDRQTEMMIVTLNANASP